MSERVNVKKFVHWIKSHKHCSKWKQKQFEVSFYLVWICWWRVLLTRWWHDDAVWFYSTFRCAVFSLRLEDVFDCSTFFYRAFSTNANSPSTIWYSHKLFVFRMAMKADIYRDGKAKRGERKERKINIGGKTAQEATHFLSYLERTFLSFAPNMLFSSGFFCS